MKTIEFKALLPYVETILVGEHIVSGVFDKDYNLKQVYHNGKFDKGFDKEFGKYFENLELNKKMFDFINNYEFYEK